MRFARVTSAYTLTNSARGKNAYTGASVMTFLFIRVGEKFGEKEPRLSTSIYKVVTLASMLSGVFDDGKRRRFVHVCRIVGREISSSFVPAK